MAKTPEGAVKDAIKKVLAAHGVIRATSILQPDEACHGWYYMPVSNGMGVHGIPDFIICYKGRFIGIEAKAPKGEPTKAQLINIDLITKAGGVVFVCRDASDVIRVLTEIGAAHG